MAAAVVALLVMLALQTQLIFPTHAVAPAGPLPPGAERLSITTPDSNTLQGVYVPPANETAASTLVLGFGGNAWNGQEVATYLHELYPEAHVVAFHYRGYAPSTGAPSAEALLADAPLVYDLAVERVKPRKAVAVGFSIGSGVAAQLTRQRKLDGLILVTPFDSLKAVAQSLYPWLPMGSLFRHEMDAVGALEGNRVPVAIVAAQHDQIVPADRTEALRKRVPNLVFDRTIPSAGHNDIYSHGQFQQAMREALTAVTQ